MQALSLGLRAPYRLKRWVTLLAQASLRLDFTKGGPLDSRVTFTRASGGTSFRPVGYGPELLVDKSNLNGSTTRLVVVAPGALGRAFLITGASGLHWHDGTGITPITSNSVVVWPASGPGGFLNLYNNTAGVLPLSGVSVQQVILDRPGDPIQLFTAPVNVPRFDYDPVTGACRGMLVERVQRTNELSHSDCKTDVAYYFPGGNVVDHGIDYSVTAPDGSQGMRKLEINGWQPARFGSASGGQANQPYTASMWIASADGATRTVRMGPNDGEIDHLVTPALRRISTTFATNAGYRFVDLVANGGLYYVWGVQLELGSFATSYIPTLGAAYTRAIDNVSIETVNPWLTDAATLHFEYSLLKPESNLGVFFAGSGGDNCVHLWQKSATNAQFEVFVAGLNIGAAGFSNMAGAMAVNRVAVSFGSGVVPRAASRGAAVANGPMNGRPVINRVDFFANRWGATEMRASGHIRKFACIPKAHGTLDLQGLTR